MKVNRCQKCNGEPKLQWWEGITNKGRKVCYWYTCHGCGYSISSEPTPKKATKWWNHVNPIQNPLLPIDGSAEYRMSQKKGGE